MSTDRRRSLFTSGPWSGVITLACMDESARNHALAEGAPDPYPLPRAVRERQPERDLRLAGEVEWPW